MTETKSTTPTPTEGNDPTALHAEIARLNQLVADLKHNVEVYRRLAFGPSSEKRKTDAEPALPHGQGHLFYADLVAEVADAAERNGVDATIEARPPKKPRKPRGRRSKFPAHVPEITTRYELPEAARFCGCGHDLHEIGVESAKELERIELTFVHVYERVKYACRSCTDGVRVAPGPDRALDKGILGTGFLSYLLNERFGNHMPYYRIEKKLGKEGLDVARSVLQRSAARCADELRPLYERLRAHVQRQRVIFTDDTPVTIAQPTGKAQGSKKGHVWIYLDRSGNHFYEFTDSWKKDAPEQWLAGFQGTVHCDKYKGYESTFDRDDVDRAGCWAHARRKFIDAESSDPDVAAEILARIRSLYAVEAEARDAELNDDERRDLRQRKTVPILTDLHARLAVLEASSLPKSPTGKAASYALRQWEDLTRFIDDGALELDNNSAERAMRPLGVGRKNWLFFLNDNGADAAMVIMSLLRTAEAMGLNAIEYFRDVLVRIKREPDLDKLLPAGWKEHFADEVANRRTRAYELLTGRSDL